MTSTREKKPRRAKATRTTIVVDTSLIFVEPQIYNIPGLKDLEPADYIVPATCIWELDRLMERVDRRDRARSALNVLHAFADRGACEEAVSCGERATIRIAAFEDRLMHDALDPTNADDRILSTALHAADTNATVVFATGEFAQYAKAKSLRLSALYLPPQTNVPTVVSRREQDSFETAWNRVEAAATPWSVCRRALTFLRTTLARRFLGSIRGTKQPPDVHYWLSQFDQLGEQWTGAVVLDTILKPIFDLDPPRQPNYAVADVTVPGRPWSDLTATFQEHQARQRAESEEERVIRIRAEERAHRDREEFIMDNILDRLQVIREYVLDQIGDDAA
jgi:hypothetical protein